MIVQTLQKFLNHFTLTYHYVEQEPSLHERIELGETREERAHDLVFKLQLALCNHEHEESRRLLLLPLRNHLKSLIIIAKITVEELALGETVFEAFVKHKGKACEEVGLVNSRAINCLLNLFVAVAEFLSKRLRVCHYFQEGDHLGGVWGINEGF